jgi:hypothetical protein
MAILFSNNASTTISGSITTGSTTVQLAAGTGALFPHPTGGDYFVATFYDQATKTINEIVHVTNITGDVATIVRGNAGFGVDQTLPRAWNAGDIFANLVTAGTLNAFVQAGTGPVNTSMIYYGADTSTTPNLIICTTNPVPASMVPGLFFEIKVANATIGSGPVNVQLNGLASIRAIKTNGGDIGAGDMFASQNYIFMYNGVSLCTTLQPVAQKTTGTLPATTFYVRSDSTSTIDSNGIESQDGLANTVGSAFRHIQGAVNTIKQNYISQNTITIRVADGTYVGDGAYITNGFIAAWNIIGNTSSPSNCVVDCTSTNAATYIPGMNAGSCFGGQGSGINITIQGFYMRSYYSNADNVGGAMAAINCYYTAPVVGSPTCGASGGGNYTVGGTNNYFSGANACDCWLSAYNSGSCGMGGHDVYGTSSTVINIVGNPVMNRAFVEAISAGTITIFQTTVSFPGGTPQGPQYYCDSGGGINFMDGGTWGFPGSQPGVVFPPGWV